MTASLPMVLGQFIADAPRMQQWFPRLNPVQQLQGTPFLIVAVLDCCLAIAYIALWRTARDFRAFRWLGIFYASIGIQQFCQYFGGVVPYWCLRATAAGILVEAAGEAMQVPRRQWTRFFWPLYLFVSVAVWFPSMAFTGDWPVPVSEVPLVILVVQGFRSKSRRDRMIAAAFGIYAILRMTLFGPIQRFLGIEDHATILGWHWQFTFLGSTTLGIVTLTVFARELIRDRAEKQRLSAELEAGRAVQQVLIPEEIPTVPGFTIQSVYRPYGEVGGDFFQILPLPDGGVLIAIGDVSGKGMPAAMLVSLIVGALHALTRTSTRPADLLKGLNESVRRRSSGGFTTCLILRLLADGTLTFANAGHIPPYLNGEELCCENGLPLGLAAEADYAESSLQLSIHDQLTLLTDGVVEARSKSGELFGFERTAGVSAQSAESIATQAQEFGQEDDITVLTVRSVMA